MDNFSFENINSNIKIHNSNINLTAGVRGQKELEKKIIILHDDEVLNSDKKRKRLSSDDKEVDEDNSIENKRLKSDDKQENEDNRKNIESRRLGSYDKEGDEGYIDKKNLTNNGVNH